VGVAAAAVMNAPGGGRSEELLMRHLKVRGGERERGGVRAEIQTGERKQRSKKDFFFFFKLQKGQTDM